MKTSRTLRTTSEVWYSGTATRSWLSAGGGAECLFKVYPKLQYTARKSRALASDDDDAGALAFYNVRELHQPLKLSGCDCRRL